MADVLRMFIGIDTVVSAAAAEKVKAPKDDDLESIKSDASKSISKAVSLGFTYKVGKDGRWKASTIKPGGWAAKSGQVQTGDILVNVDTHKCTGLDLKAITRLLQVSLLGLITRIIPDISYVVFLILL